MRLLLVDDDAGFRELLRTTFEDVQVEVDEAGSAAEAEARIAASRPDVIVQTCRSCTSDTPSVARIASSTAARLMCAGVPSNSTFVDSRINLTEPQMISKLITTLNSASAAYQPNSAMHAPARIAATEPSASPMTCIHAPRRFRSIS